MARTPDPRITGAYLAVLYGRMTPIEAAERFRCCVSSVRRRLRAAGFEPTDGNWGGWQRKRITQGGS